MNERPRTLRLAAVAGCCLAVACSATPEADRATAALHECQVTVARGADASAADAITTMYRYTFDETARRLVTAVYTYDLDDTDRVTKVYGNTDAGPVWYWTTSYDAHGSVASSEHYTAGVTTYTNGYDGDRLSTVDVSGGGGPAARIVYRYEDPASPALWTGQEVDSGADGTVDQRLARTLAAGQVHTIALASGDATVEKLWTYTYDGARVSTVERDGGYWDTDVPDGTANMRFRWLPAADGTVAAFEQDGVDDTDAPFVDGKPDYREAYSPGCAPLLQRFPWVAHLPGPESVGPRWRTDWY